MTSESLDTDSQLVDGMELDYTYTTGGRVILSFYAGQLKYRWLSGPFEGVQETNLRYRSKRIGEDLYVVNWHDVGNSNFVTLIIDLPQNVVHSSALIYYGTENEVTSFDRAIINGVRRME